MRKRRTWIFLLICAPLVILLLAIFRRTPEGPTYQGRSLSKWVELYAAYETTKDEHHREEAAQAAQAVRAIGTNALPFLLQWIRYEPPFWQQRISPDLRLSAQDHALASYIINGPGYEKQKAARKAFTFLGTNAAPAIPALRIMMRETNHHATAMSAIIALSEIGAVGMPTLVSAISDTNYSLRRGVVIALAFETAPIVGTNACLPPLTAALKDPDPLMRAEASRMLSRIAPQALTNAPAQ